MDIQERTDLIKFKENTRQEIYRCLIRPNKNKKHYLAEKILGCSIEYFKDYITSKLQKNMSFDNYGQWHLDHIIQLSTANSKEDILKLNHYTNFQPLWAKENLKREKPRMLKKS